jgi:hypothetical protein
MNPFLDTNNLSGLFTRPETPKSFKTKVAQEVTPIDEFEEKYMEFHKWVEANWERIQKLWQTL